MDRTFSAHPDRVSEARVSVTRWLDATSTRSTHLLDDVALAVSEACTNAVVHAYRNEAGQIADPSFRVVAEQVGSDVQVTVSDTGVGLTPRVDSPGLGLGLPLIATLAKTVDIHAGAGGGGTVVSMLFAGAPALPADEVRWPS